MRINKYLADSGVGSRRNVEDLILNGKIKVNGIVNTNLSTQISDSDVVTYNNKVVKPVGKFIYIMVNKPNGYLTTVSDMYNRKTIMDLVKDINERIYPVGRLDYNTEGLIVLTNDGEFANRVIHPKSNIKKTYEVVVKYPLSKKDMDELCSGLVIDGYKTTPAIIENYKKIGNKYMFNLSIFEGRNRQIRKMVELVKNEVSYLRRLSIGNLSIGNLKVGKYRELTTNDIKKIFM